MVDIHNSTNKKLDIKHDSDKEESKAGSSFNSPLLNNKLPHMAEKCLKENLPSKELPLTTNQSFNPSETNGVSNQRKS